LLAESFPKLVEETTKWQRVCNVVTKLHAQRCNEFLGVVCQGLLFALRRGEIAEADVTVQFLVGGREAHDGFAQTMCVKQACLDWVSESLVLARDLSPGAPYVLEMHDKVLRTLASPKSVMQEFHKTSAPARDDDMEVEADVTPVEQSAFIGWQKKLEHEVCRLLATFMYRLHIGLYDEDPKPGACTSTMHEGNTEEHSVCRCTAMTSPACC
jgi:hypothetical protein